MKKALAAFLAITIYLSFSTWGAANPASKRPGVIFYPVIAGYERFFRETKERFDRFDSRRAATFQTAETLDRRVNPSTKISVETDFQKFSKKITAVPVLSIFGPTSNFNPTQSNSKITTAYDVPNQNQGLRIVQLDRREDFNFSRLIKVAIFDQPGISSDLIGNAIGSPILFPSININHVFYSLADNITIAQSSPNDTYYASQWALSALNIESAWGFTRGAGITVAVIDSGVQYSHEDIAANIWSNLGEISGNGIDDDFNGYIDDIQGWNFRDGNSNISDTYGHGTHVAGIVGALNNNSKGISGVAPDVRIMGLRAISGTESTYVAVSVSIEAAISAVRYAVDMGARVINMSIGYLLSYFTGDQFARMQDTVRYARTKGAIVVAAAGNDYSNINIYPALWDDVIAVGALYKSSFDGTIARDSYSNYGSQLDVMAPGTSIASLRMSGSSYSNYNGNANYTQLSGTSMAAPMVSGVIALLLAQNPLQTFDDIYRRLKFSSTDKGATGFDIYNGWGMINPFKALSEDYYDSGFIKTRFLTLPDMYDITRKEYDLVGNLINQYDAFGNRPTFKYYSGTSNVEQVTFYNAQNVLQQTNEYYANGTSIHFRIYPSGHILEYDLAGWLQKENFSNGDIVWYFSSGNKSKYFKVQRGQTTEYLDENFFGSATGRVVKTAELDGSHTDYQGYYKGKNIARYIRQYDSAGNLTITTQRDVFGTIIPDRSSITYYQDGILQSYTQLSSGIRYKYYDEDYYGNQTGRIQNETHPLGREYVYTYWPGTDTVSTRQILQESNELITEYFDSKGVLQQRKYPSLNIRNYYESGRLQSAYHASTGRFFEYQDESFYDNYTGRLAKITYPDQSYVVIKKYYLNSIQPLQLLKYDKNNSLLGVFDYDSSGNLISSVGAYDKNIIQTPSQSISQLKVNNHGHMVWQGTSSLGFGWGIWYYDGQSTQLLTGSNTNNKNPVINSQDKIAWEKYWYTNYEIALYDGSTTRNITNNSWDDDLSWGMMNNQGQIVWEVGSKHEVYIFDGSQTAKLDPTLGWEGSPRINDSGSVVFKSGYDVYVKPAGSWWISPIKISTGIPNASSPDINNQGQVVFSGDNGSGDKQIYLYNGSTALQITNDNFDNKEPRINNKGQVAWLGGDWGHYDVFFFDGSLVHKVTNDGKDHKLIGLNDFGHVIWQRGLSDKEIFIFDGYQNHLVTSNAYQIAVDINGTMAWTQSSGSALYLAKPMAYQGNLPDLVEAPTYGRYSNGRIKYRVFADSRYEEYRDENYYGDNIGRKTLLRDSANIEERYLEYWGDLTSQDFLDDTEVVKRMERYEDGAFSYRRYYYSSGILQREVRADGSESRYIEYWPGTNKVRVEERYQAEVLLKTIEYYSNGLDIQKVTLPNSSYTEYYLSRNQKKVFDNSSGNFTEYLDENFYGNDSQGFGRGRKNRELAFTGFEFRYIEYWTGTDKVKVKDFYQSNVRRATYEYDSTGNNLLKETGYRNDGRLDYVSQNGIKTIYVYAGDSIQTAIDGAAAGDVILIGAGTYNERIILKNGVSIKGVDAKTTIINGGSVARTNVVLALGNNRIENLTITGGGPFMIFPASAVRVEGSGVYLLGNRIIDNPNYAVHVWWTAGSVTIKNNLFLNNDLAIQLPQNQTVIEYNTFVNNNITINILGGATPRVENNIITGSRFQSIYEFAWGQVPTDGYAQVSNNTLYNNAEKGGYYSNSLPPAIQNQTNGNRIADPLFANPSTGDYSLQPGSPASGRGAFASGGGAAPQMAALPPRPPSQLLTASGAVNVPVVSRELNSYLDMKNKKMEERKSASSPIIQTSTLYNNSSP